MRRLIPPAPDQEIQPQECCGRCTESDNDYTFRVERIQGQIDEPICAHDDQSQGANRVDRSAHAASPVNASVDQERLCPLPTLVGAMLRYKARLVEEIHNFFAHHYRGDGERQFWGATPQLTMGDESA